MKIVKLIVFVGLASAYGAAAAADDAWYFMDTRIYHCVAITKQFPANSPTEVAEIGLALGHTVKLEKPPNLPFIQSVIDKNYDVAFIFVKGRDNCEMLAADQYHSKRN